MGTGDALSLDTDRLSIREADAGDLQGLHRVFASNPDFLITREDMVPYDIETVTRYCEAATLAPGRHVLSVVEKSTGAMVGLVDFVDQSPADGEPWIGLVIIDGEYQRRGFGTEVVHALADLLKSQGRRTVRMAVLEDDEAGLAFSRNVGFEAYGHAGTGVEGAPSRVTLMEMAVDPQTTGDQQ